MDSTCSKLITLVCTSGDTFKVSQKLLEESSNYLSQVLMNCNSKVLLFPDVQFEDLKNLMDQVESGRTFDENLCEIALKYGFKPENTEHLPLKKRPLEHSPPSSPELIIDESYSPREESPSYPRSVSPPSEDSLAPFLPWPLLLQQVAMQNSLKDSDKSSNTTKDSTKILQEPIESSKSLDIEESVSCKECGKIFRASNLQIHMRRVHRVLQKPVKCCGQEFPTRWHLTQHRKSGDHLPTLWKTEGST